MTNTNQRLKDYLMNRAIDEQSDGYWTYTYQSGLMNSLVGDSSYDGKFRISGTLERLGQAISNVRELVRNRKVVGAKYVVNPDIITPGMSPVVLVYVPKKDKEGTERMFASMGLENITWIDDNKTALQWTLERRRRELEAQRGGEE